MIYQQSESTPPDTRRVAAAWIRTNQLKVVEAWLLLTNRTGLLGGMKLGSFFVVFPEWFDKCMVAAALLWEIIPLHFSGRWRASTDTFDSFFPYWFRLPVEVHTMVISPLRYIPGLELGTMLDKEAIESAKQAFYHLIEALQCWPSGVL
jgi:hypothetical protein